MTAEGGVNLIWLAVIAIVVLNAVAFWILKRWVNGKNFARKEDLKSILIEVQNIAAGQKALQKRLTQSAPKPESSTRVSEFTELFGRGETPKSAPAPGEFTRMFQAPLTPPAPQPAAPPPASPGEFTVMFAQRAAAEIKVFYATDRRATGSPKPAEGFGAERSPTGELSYGSCKVSIPRDHRLGALEAPNLLKLQFT